MRILSQVPSYRLIGYRYMGLLFCTFFKPFQQLPVADLEASLGVVGGGGGLAGGLAGRDITG